MENASKALIIAGAILLSILIISLGMMVYTNAKDSVDNVGDLSTEKAQVFNEKFAPYLGKKMTQKQTNQLIDLIVANNATNPEHKIIMGHSGNCDQYVNSTEGFKGYFKPSDDKIFKDITAEYDTKGYICKIKAVSTN